MHLIAFFVISCHRHIVDELDLNQAKWVNKKYHCKNHQDNHHSYGHLSVTTGYFSGIIHSINGVTS